MSSSYSCIITKEPIEVPIKIPHFKKSGVLTIPIDAEGYDVSDFLKFFSDGNLHIPPEFLRNDEDAEDLDDPDEQQWVFGTPENILEELRKLNLIYKGFILLYTADFADIPTDEYQAAFENGNRIGGTYYSTDNESPSADDNYATAFSHFGITHDDVFYFRDFQDAANKYVKITFKPGLWRS